MKRNESLLSKKLATIKKISRKKVYFFVVSAILIFILFCTINIINQFWVSVLLNLFGSIISSIIIAVGNNVWEKTRRKQNTLTDNLINEITELTLPEFKYVILSDEDKECMFQFPYEDHGYYSEKIFEGFAYLSELTCAVKNIILFYPDFSKFTDDIMIISDVIQSKKDIIEYTDIWYLEPIYEFDEQTNQYEMIDPSNYDGEISMYSVKQAVWTDTNNYLELEDFKWFADQFTQLSNNVDSALQELSRVKQESIKQLIR